MDEHAIETFEHEGVVITLHYDDEPQSPRDWDNLGTMLCNYRGYDLGDSTIDPGEHESLAALIEWLREEYKPTYILPLYILDHSGLAMSAGAPITSRSPEKEVDDTNHFICDPGGWDTSLVGFIFDTPEAIEAYGTSPEHVLEGLQGEVETYDAYLQGQVYGYVVAEGEESCWGFYDLDDCREEAKDAAEGVAQQRAKELADRNTAAIAASATYAWNGEEILV